MMRPAAVLLLLSHFATAQADAYADAIQAGRKAFEASRYEDAQTHFNRARLLAPDDWRGHAYLGFTLIEQALNSKDRQRRAALLQEADKVTGVLIKRRIILLQDPLYKFLQGMIQTIAGDHGKAFRFLDEAYKTPKRRFEPYAEVELRRNVERAFAKASLQMATHAMMVGAFAQADVWLDEAAKVLPESDPNRAPLERQMAAVAEHLGNQEAAIQHLRACIRLSKDRPEVKEELTGNIAMIYFVGEQFDRGRATLNELPPDTKHPEVVAARAMMHYKRAIKEPDGETMDAALAFYRNAMQEFPPDDRQRLVTPFAELVLERVGPRNAKQERELLLSAVKLLLTEIDLHPECPSIYFHLYRIHRLLGEQSKEIYYQEMHKRKKDEWKLKHKELYDARGRPRCR